MGMAHVRNRETSELKKLLGEIFWPAAYRELDQIIISLLKSV